MPLEPWPAFQVFLAGTLFAAVLYSCSLAVAPKRLRLSMWLAGVGAVGGVGGPVVFFLSMFWREIF